MIQRQYNRATKLSVCHVEFFLSTFIWADKSKRCPLCVWEGISDVAGQVCLNDQATKAWFTSTRGVYHSQISSSWNLESFMSDWRESTICCKCRHWMRSSSSSLLRQMAEVYVGSDTEVLLGVWVKLTLYSSSRKTSIISSPQLMPTLIEKLRGNMKRFKLEVQHVKRNRNIKMARSLESDPPSLSKRPS